MKIESFELRQVRLALVTPFRTSFGVQTHRHALLVKASAESEGWGECTAGEAPYYSSEHTEGAELVIRRHLAPLIFGAPEVTAEKVGAILGPVKGHRMAKSALETAILDSQLRAEGSSFASYLGAVRGRVDCGVSVGIAPSLDALVEWVGGYIDAGYRRVKLKIEPGWDLEAVSTIRSTFGVDLPLQVDANTAYRSGDLDHLAELDRYGLLLIEQPFDEHDLLAHAELAKRIETPVCLDESVVSSATCAQALDLGACSIVNIKPGRVGGYLEAKRIHDLCASRGVAVWCGGMLETGIGRAANLALAALPNFTLPGDTSASDRYFERDLVTPPFVLDEGRLEVPRGPGIGVSIDPKALESATVGIERLTP